MEGKTFGTSIIRSTAYVAVSIVTMLVGILGVQGVLQMLYNEDVPPRTLGVINTAVTITETAVCGNNIIEATEECDNTSFGDNTCVSLGYYDGNLGCNVNCTLNTSNCTTLATYCGNGIINTGEECDISHFGTQTCSTFGFDIGDLICNDNCTVNKSDCSFIIIPTEEITSTPTIIPSAIEYIYPTQVVVITTNNTLPDTGNEAEPAKVDFHIEDLLHEPAVYIPTGAVVTGVTGRWFWGLFAKRRKRRT